MNVRTNPTTAADHRTRLFFPPALLMTLLLAAAVVTLSIGGSAAGPGEVVLVSCSSSGEKANQKCGYVSFDTSAEGRYVVFSSAATNLGPSVTEGAAGQVFRKDVSTGEVLLCSSNASGQCANNYAGDCTISADGRYVAFSSTATNLVSGPVDKMQVFRKDLKTGEVSYVSTDSNGQPGDNFSSCAAISADGRYVAFQSFATNFTGSSSYQIYRKDLVTGQLRICSSNRAGDMGSGWSEEPDISADGRFVSFESSSNNLLPPASYTNIYRKDMETGEIAVCSSNQAGVAGGSYSLAMNSISSDGRFVAFSSKSLGVPGAQVYRKDLATGGLTLCSSNSQGTPAEVGDPTVKGAPESDFPSISADGRFVSFVSSSNNLIDPPTPRGWHHIYRKDLVTGETSLWDSNSSGNIQDQGTERISPHSMSRDGRYLAFYSWATNLVPGVDGDQIYRKELPLQVLTPTWYLAEGSTAWGFETYISIQNPNKVAVTADITYMTERGPVPGGAVALPPESQGTVNVTQQVMPSQDFSTTVTCREGRSIAVDRTMFWTGGGAPCQEGHSSVGVTAPATTWYLPEGSSDWGFECFLLIQNPNPAVATCRVTYMIENGGPQTVEHAVPPNSRRTFNMESDIGRKDASIRVVSDLPVIPERAMYRNMKREGQDSIGTTGAAEEYFLAEGTTAWGFETYVLVQNPNEEAVDVTVTYMTPAGAKPQEPFNLAANSRKTIKVNDVPGMAGTDCSTRVHGSKPIIAERAMYWGKGTPLGEACHDSIGMSEPHVTFYLPDGEASADKETFTCVQNPNPEDVWVEITYMTPAGAGSGAVFGDTVPANSRKTYKMVDTIQNTRAAIMVTCRNPGKKIMVERSMYWNNRGAGTDTIGGYSD